VQVWAEVAGEVGAAITAGGEHRFLGFETVDRSIFKASAITPRQWPSSSMIRSSAKYSMKNSRSVRSDWP
jgi:hypothetical protein